jgi:hypothetical protein
MIEQFAKPEVILTPDRAVLEHFANEFLGRERKYISDELYNHIVDEVFGITESLLASIEMVNEDKKIVTYDKFKKTFLVNNEPVTAGQIIAARHLDDSIVLPKQLDQSGLGKKLRKTYTEQVIKDQLCTRLNHELATILADEYRNRDMFKSQAYEKIAERSVLESEQEQIGVIAESVMQGFAEMIAVDRPDLGITVAPANAYQDVAEKIDFIVTTKTKKRGAGIEVVDPLIEERHIGIQFTVNTSEKTREHKQDQIEKAKARGTDLDDIVYFAFDMKTLQKAIHAWEQLGKPLSGVWNALPKGAQAEAIRGLFTTLLTDEQEASLLKPITEQ